MLGSNVLEPSDDNTRLIWCQSYVNPMSIQYYPKVNWAAKLYHWGTNQVPIPTHQSPFWRQFVANLMPTLSQSHINQVPIHCQSYQSCANLVPFLCKFIANPLPMQYQSTAMWCQSSANTVPIWGPRPLGWLSPTPGVSMHCKCDANGPIQSQSTANIRLICHSIINLLI